MNGPLVQMSSLTEAKYELQEALSEIKRHHRDFKKISRILDDVDAGKRTDTAKALKAIRNVVG